MKDEYYRYAYDWAAFHKWGYRDGTSTRNADDYCAGQTYIDLYDGETINGMYVSESGILAAAHLGGQGSVKRYFRNGKVFRDGNGTKITSYMKQFSGYDIKLN